MNEEATASSCLNVATGLTSYQIYYNGRTQYSKSFFGYIQRQYCPNNAEFGGRTQIHTQTQVIYHHHHHHHHHHHRH